MREGKKEREGRKRKKEERKGRREGRREEIRKEKEREAFKIKCSMPFRLQGPSEGSITC